MIRALPLVVVLAFIGCSRGPNPGSSAVASRADSAFVEQCARVDTSATGVVSCQLKDQGRPAPVRKTP
jgi:hypothetical protein